MLSYVIWNDRDQMDVFDYLKRKEEECIIERTVGIGTSQFGD